jgi:phenylalanyl-tRNA synthetase alpha chain
MTLSMENLEQKVGEVLAALQEAKDPALVEAIRVEYLGRKGHFTGLMRGLREVPAEQRPAAGQRINDAKQQLLDALAQATEACAAGASAGEQLDVTLPGRAWPTGHKHPISQVMEDMVAIFRRMGFVVADGPDIETEYFNFDALNTPADHPSRDVQDTFYFPDGRLLRTQTSPVQIRVMENQEPPVRVICPGRCYRRDTPDATHSMNFHQIEGLYVDRNVSLADLKGTLQTFAHELLGPDVKIRFRPHFFPFTEPSLEYDFSCIMCGGKGCRVCKNSGWLEISGAGMVDPAVLQTVGYDPEKYTGFAFGMGLERIAMIRHAIGDIRLLYENDVRFLAQF